MTIERTSARSEAAELSEIRALLDGRAEACRAKDIDLLMSLYAPDSIYFDVVPPLQFMGSAAIRRNFLRWFNEYEGPIGLETSNMNIVVSGVSRSHICCTGTAETGTGTTPECGCDRPFAANG
jgi:ketosteroid isomerase-like protein